MRPSTILLILLLLFIVYAANAQVTIKEIKESPLVMSLGNGESYQTATLYGKTITTIDTIKSYILVSLAPGINNTYKPCYTVLGYEIIKQDGYSFECSYLRIDKTPLDKYLVVWMSIPVKK